MGVPATVQRRTLLKGLLAGGLVAAAPARGVWTIATTPGAVRVYVVIVDGLRPDEVALMPQLSELAATGTHYPHARAEMVAETSTNHVSMLTGMRATRHGIPANAVPGLPQRPSDQPRYLRADSLFTLMRRQAPELVTANIGAKTYVADVGRHDRTGDGQTDATYTNTPRVVVPVALDSAPDEETGTEAVLVSQKLDPDFLFLNLGDVDRVGHFDETGGLTDGRAPLARLATLQRADLQLRRLVTELRLSGRWDQSVFIVTADHSMDWSRPDRGLNLAPLFEADDLLRSEIRAAINGGASLYALRSPDEDRAQERLARAREIALSVEGIEHALYIRPNPLDGGDEHWIGRVFPQWGLHGDLAGDMIVTVRSGYRLGHSADLPAIVANPIPGNHGHPVTLPIPIIVSGGWPGVRQQALLRAPAPPDTEEAPDQARNIDLAPTVAWLLGLNPPPGGFDGRVLLEAFDHRPEPRVEVRNVASMPTVERIGSADEFETAVALSTLAFPNGAATVVVTGSESFADGVAATPLAISRGGPVLPARHDGLPPAVAAEVRRLEPDRAYVIGDATSLGPRVEQDLREGGVTDIVRLAGSNRFEVAAAIARELGVDAGNRQAVLATGAGGMPAFVTAIGVGPVAAASHPRIPTDDDGTRLPNQGDFTSGGGIEPRPVLWIKRHGVPAATHAVMADLAIDRAIVAGSAQVVSDKVVAELRGRGVLVERILADDAWGTAVQWAERGIREGAFTDRLFVVPGAASAHGLGVGATVGRLGGTLLPVPPGRLQGAARDFVSRRADEFVHVHLVGSETVLSPALANDIVQLIRDRRTRPA